MPLVTANASVLGWARFVEEPGWPIEVTANPVGEGKRRWFLNDFQYRCSADTGDGPVGTLSGLRGTIGVAILVLGASVVIQKLTRRRENSLGGMSPTSRRGNERGSCIGPAKKIFL